MDTLQQTFQLKMVILRSHVHDSERFAIFKNSKLGDLQSSVTRVAGKAQIFISPSERGPVMTGGLVPVDITGEQKKVLWFA